MHVPAWLSLDLVLKIFMPLLTFTLGGFATLRIKNVEKRNNFVKEQVRAVWTLTNDWYNQLIDLRAKGIDPEITTDEMQRCVFVYVHNRIILPKLLLSLELLRKTGKYREMVRIAEEFLELVTTYQSESGHGFVSDRAPSWVYEKREDWDSVTCRPGSWIFSKAFDDADPTLQKLDAIIQKMTLLAASVLSEEETRARKTHSPATARL